MKKRRHHYVWREYLRRWAVDDKIWCRFDSGKIVHTNLANVAQKRDFYAPKDLSNSEVDFLSSVIERIQSPVLKSELHSLLRGMQNISNSIDTLVWLQQMTGDDLKEDDANLHNALEDLQGEIETSASEYLTAARVGDLRFFENNETRLKFAHYCCTQFFRTKKMKRKVENDVLEWAKDARKTVRFESVWQLMQHIYASKLAMGLAGRPDQYRICLLTSRSPHEFITGDQPLFNIHAVGLKAAEDIKGMQFYYPIAPDKALFWGEDVNGSSHLGHILIDESAVSRYNNMIFQESESQVYAASEEAIKILTDEP